MDGSSGPAILVIDDDRNQRSMLSFALRGEGYQVTAVENGGEAIAAAKEKRFDAAICDVMMPGLGGVETLKLLREAQPELKVIMATGFGSAQSALASMKNGASGYIDKPYELKELSMALAQALGR